eukprot:jgi/Bigna1/89862/estExt_fgenesh1_pg.C_570009
MSKGSWKAFADFPTAFSSAIIGPDGAVWGSKGVWTASRSECLKMSAPEDGCVLTCGGNSFLMVNRIDPRSHKEVKEDLKEKGDKKGDEDGDEKKKINPLDYLNDAQREKYEGIEPLEDRLEVLDTENTIWFGVKVKGHYCLVIKELTTPQCTLAAIVHNNCPKDVVIQSEKGHAEGMGCNGRFQGGYRQCHCNTADSANATLNFTNQNIVAGVGYQFGESWGSTGTWNVTQFQAKHWVGLATGSEKRGMGKFNSIAEYKFHATKTDQGIYYDEGNKHVLVVHPLKKVAILAVAPEEKHVQLLHEIQLLAKSLTNTGY